MQLFKKRSTTAVAAFVLAGAVAFGTYQFIAHKVEGPPTLPVVVSTVAMQKGQTFNVSQMKVEYLPVTQIPPQAIHIASELNGHIASDDIAQNSPILTSDVQQQTGVSSIPNGYVAIAVPTDLASSSGDLMPGDTVDVYAAIGGHGSDSSSTVRPVIDGAKVLDVLNSNDTSASAPSSSSSGGGLASASDSSDGSVPAVVRLLIKPSDIETVVDAESNGTIYLVNDPYSSLGVN